MKSERLSSATDAHPATLAHWRWAGGVFAAALAVLLLTHGRAVAAWVELWLFSGQEYGLVVFLASAWLLWRCRDRLAPMRPSPDWRSLWATVPLSLAFLVAYATDVQVLQFALLVAALGILTWAVLGAAVLRVVAYPIAFLWVALPIARYLEPALQDMTVAATVVGLRLTGLPVYVDDTYIHIPQGAIVVLERCSGAQFLQAGLTIGALYAYLNFRVIRLRVAAFGAFVVAAIVGNWVRVYGLCFLGVLTERQHFLFGWAMFAAALVPTFWFCLRLQSYEDRRWPAPEAPAAPSDSSTTASRVMPPASFLRVAAVTTLLLIIAPVIAHQLASASWHANPIQPVSAHAPWVRGAAPQAEWRPVFGGADGQAQATYSSGAREIAAFWVFYALQRQGAEVINELNTVYDPAVWQPRGGKVGTESIDIIAGGNTLRVTETRLERLQGGDERVVWHWYEVGGRPVAGSWRAKLAQLAGYLRGRPDAMVTVLSTSAPDTSQARAALEDFVTAHLPELEAAGQSARAAASDREAQQ